ncbi:MAG: hypothetical protein ACOX8U_04910 [Bradymonadia bacterium]|jgi:hypothetical protein
MFRRFSLVISLCAAASLLSFAACDKKEKAPNAADTAANLEVKADDAAEPAADAAAPEAAAEAAAEAVAGDAEAAPADDAAEAEANEEAVPNVPVPPEAQAALDHQLQLMETIAAAAEKENCADVLAELKAIPNEATEKAQAAGKTLETLSPEVQKALADANQSKLISLTMRFMAFQKCETSPEKDAVTAEITRLLQPDADAPAAAEAPAAE